MLSATFCHNDTHKVETIVKTMRSFACYTSNTIEIRTQCSDKDTTYASKKAAVALETVTVSLRSMTSSCPFFPQIQRGGGGGEGKPAAHLLPGTAPPGGCEYLYFWR